MTDEDRELVEKWILAFCEPPPVVDAELMRRLLAEPHLPKETAP